MRFDSKNRALFDLKAKADVFAAGLREHCDWFSAVPDSVFKRVLPNLPNWHLATRENHAIGMAFGARIGGLRPAVLIQNSGLGLCLDALIGTFTLYGQGLLMVVSNRGRLEWEEIQHRDWGLITKPLLSAAGIAASSFDEEGMQGLSRAAALAEGGKVAALLIDRGNIDE
jgi:sulfopyruvate decarboxylase subunit alpha